MNIVSCNVKCGAPPLVDHLGDVLRKRNADVVVLTETSIGCTESLRAAPVASGWPHVEATVPTRYELGVMVAARKQLRLVELEGVPVPTRELIVTIDSLKVSLMGVYAPLVGTLGREKNAQAEFWAWLRKELETRRGEPLVVAVNFNTCVGEDGAGKDLAGAKEFKMLLGSGWGSAYRIAHPKGTARSWRHRVGTGFRIDDVLVQPGVVVKSAEYHTEVGGVRLAPDSKGKQAKALSDHAPISARLVLGPPPELDQEVLRPDSIEATEVIRNARSAASVP